MKSFLDWLKGAVLHNWHTSLLGILGAIFVWSESHGVTVSPEVQQKVFEAIAIWMAAHGLASKDGNKTGKSDSGDVGGIGRINRSFALLLACLLAFGAVQSCAKRKAGESDADFKARQKAIFSAQAVTGLNAWSDAVEVLGNGGALDANARRVQITVNEQVLSGLDIVRARLITGLNGEALDKVQAIITDLREAQRREVVRFSGATKEQLEIIFDIGLFALESLQAVLEESKQPARAAEIEAKAQSAQRAAVVIPPYLTGLIAVARDAGFAALRQSRLSKDDAYKAAEELSGLLHSKNAARLAALHQ